MAAAVQLEQVPLQVGMAEMVDAVLVEVEAGPAKTAQTQVLEVTEELGF